MPQQRWTDLEGGRRLWMGRWWGSLSNKLRKSLFYERVSELTPPDYPQSYPHPGPEPAIPRRVMIWRGGLKA